jgi:DNA-binding MarR family transcriptional regulator
VRSVSSVDDDTDRKIDQVEERFELLFSGFRQHLQEHARAIDSALTPAGYRTLKTLAHLGPTNQAVLAEVLGFDKSSLSRQLHQLADLGLVSRTQDATDGRAAVVRVTPEAHARLEGLRAEARGTFRARLADWAPDDLDALCRLLAALQEVSPAR